MRNFKIAIPFLLFLLFGISCQKESVQLDIDTETLENWTFSTDEFVSWPDIYAKYINDNRKAKNGSQAIRSATEDEADIVNQITSSPKMSLEIETISGEIGDPNWSYLMAFETNSIHEDFELFVPLLDNSELKGVLSITRYDEAILIRALKRNTLDHLVRNNVDPNLIQEQIGTVSAFNIFEKIQYSEHTPQYEIWYDEVFAEGYEKESNAKEYQETVTVWRTTYSGGITVSFSEERYTSYNICILQPDEIEIQDPFGSNSELYFSPIDLLERSTSSGPSTTSTVSINTYVDLSPFIPLLYEELIIDNTVTPCVKDIIKKIKDGKFGSKLFVQVLRDIFDTNEEFNVEIEEANLSADQDALWVGSPNFGSDQNLLTGTLTINSDYSVSATEDWILASIIHEMIHGYIEYQKYLVDRGDLSQGEFDSMFPLYKAGSDDPDHTVMAYSYINVIADILQENNANLTRYEALSLSRVGLLGNPFFARNFSQEELDDTTKANEIGRGTPPDPNAPSNSSTITATTSKQKNC